MAEQKDTSILVEVQSFLDEFKDKFPDGKYKDMCDKLKKSYESEEKILFLAKVLEFHPNGESGHMEFQEHLQFFYEDKARYEFILRKTEMHSLAKINKGYSSNAYICVRDMETGLSEVHIDDKPSWYLPSFIIFIVPKSKWYDYIYQSKYLGVYVE